MYNATNPTIVLIDVQNEYVTPGRPFFLQEVRPSLDNIQRLLTQARKLFWKVIHVQHFQDGPLFNPNDVYSDFISEFSPRSDEEIIVKNKLSPFTNPAFEQAISAASGEILIAGYGSTMCCLATVVDAALFGRKFTFVHDASWARAPGPDFTEAETHRHATAIIGIHGRLQTTDALLAAQNS